MKFPSKVIVAVINRVTMNDADDDREYGELSTRADESHSELSTRADECHNKY